VEHAVIACLKITEDQLDLRREYDAVDKLTDEIARVIDENEVGEFDGEEVGGGLCVLYMYGPDADRLFEVVEPVLKAAPLTRGGFVIKRYGSASDANVAETRVSL
jgi:hypothetical protein